MFKLNVLQLFLIISFSLQAKNFTHINYGLDKSEKVALVILNGFGDSKKNRKIQLDFFSNKEMDVFIPDYKQRNSLDESISSFTKFYFEFELEKYKEVNFLCYIIGGYVLNNFIESNGIKNTKRILYDRSPTQERAAKIGVDKLPLLSRIKYGRILFDFSVVSLKPLSNIDGLTIGLVIENQATKLMRFFKKASYKYGEYSFDINDIDSNYNDFFHTWLDHDLMYKRFDVVGIEILYFFQNGVFTKNAKRQQYNWDPFKKVRL
jgi:hypothetical protein